MDLFVRQKRFPIDEDDMAADTKSRKPLRELLSLIKCGAVCHQCGGSNDSLRVGLDDGTVYAGSESEVVRVDDEASQGGSVAGMRDLVANGGGLMRRTEFDRFFCGHVYS